MLSYIYFLHQTTTARSSWLTSLSCHISTFYIKPQRRVCFGVECPSCHISTFYIKPQPFVYRQERQQVVIYLLSTSNHNTINQRDASFNVVIYLLSTSNHNWQTVLPGSLGCHISTFYIKPQP